MKRERKTLFCTCSSSARIDIYCPHSQTADKRIHEKSIVITCILLNIFFKEEERHHVAFGSTACREFLVSTLQSRCRVTRVGHGTLRLTKGIVNIIIKWNVIIVAEISAAR